MQTLEHIQSVPLVDETRIQRLKTADSDLSFLTEMVELFTVRSTELLQELEVEVMAGTKRTKPLLHKLKGISFSLGAFRLAEACKWLEDEAAATGELTSDQLKWLYRIVLETREALHLFI